MLGYLDVPAIPPWPPHRISSLKADVVRSVLCLLTEFVRHSVPERLALTIRSNSVFVTKNI